MGRIGKNRAQLNVNSSISVVEEIERRCETLHLSKSAFAALILEKWLAEGAPAVSPADDALLKLRSAPTKPAKKAS